MNTIDSYVKMILEQLIALELITECEFKTSRSGGAGGQNVNKVETKVELWFDIIVSEKLLETEKAILLSKLSSKLDKHSVLHLQEQSERTQFKNKKLLQAKFHRTLLSAFKVNMPRKSTKISKSNKLQRSFTKKIDSEKKQLRRKIY